MQIFFIAALLKRIRTTPLFIQCTDSLYSAFFLPRPAVKYQSHNNQDDLHSRSKTGTDVPQGFPAPVHKMMLVQKGKTIALYKILIPDISGKYPGLCFNVEPLMPFCSKADLPYRQSFINKIILIREAVHPANRINSARPVLIEYLCQAYGIQRITLL